MTSVDGENGSVRYSVKELFARIDAKLDGLAGILDAKADHETVAAIDARVTELERSSDYNRGVYRAAWAIAALLVTIAGLLVPIVIEVLR